jgi:hypothetical protein
MPIWSPQSHLPCAQPCDGADVPNSLGPTGGGSINCDLARSRRRPALAGGSTEHFSISGAKKCWRQPRSGLGDPHLGLRRLSYPNSAGK